MKKVVLTMDLAPGVMTPNNRESFLAACRRWGADYIEIRQPVSRTHPFEEKMHIDSHVPDNSRVVWFDADSVIRADCPDPFEIITEGNLGILRACGESTTVAYSQARNVIRDYCRRGGYSLEFDDYICTGMMMFELPKHQHFFQRAREVVKKMGMHTRWEISDQLPYSISATHEKEKLWVPQMLSVQGLPAWNDWSPEMNQYVLHCAGPCNKNYMLTNTNWWHLSSEKRVDWKNNLHERRWSNGKPVGSLSNLPEVLRLAAQMWRQTIKLKNPDRGFAAWHIGQIAYYNYCKFIVEGKVSKAFEVNMEGIPYEISNRPADLTFTLVDQYANPSTE